MNGPQTATLALGALLIAPILAAPVMQPERCRTHWDIVTGGKIGTARWAQVETCTRGGVRWSSRILGEEP